MGTTTTLAPPALPTRSAPPAGSPTDPPRQPEPQPTPRANCDRLRRRQIGTPWSRLDPANPCPPLDRRWQLARLVAAGQTVPRHWLDRPTARAIGFARALAGCRRAAQRRTLFARDPDCAQAHQLYRGEPIHARWAVEAYLLAGATDAEIAQRTACTPAAITLFEQLFFQVRGLTPWARTAALGIGAPTGQPTLGAIWKTAAQGGLAVLDAVLNPLAAFQGDADLGTPAHPRFGPLRHAATTQLWYASLTAPPTAAATARLRDHLARLEALEADSDGLGPEKDRTAGLQLALRALGLNGDGTAAQPDAQEDSDGN